MRLLPIVAVVAASILITGGTVRANTLYGRQGGVRNAQPSTNQAKAARDSAEFGGLPFLLSFQEEYSYHTDAATKDLTPETKVNARIEMQLEINPHSLTEEGFPVNLQMGADGSLASLLDKTWTKNKDGRFYRVIDKVYPSSSSIGSFRCNRETLFKRPYTEGLLTVRREATRIDDRHMRVVFFFQSSSLGRAEYGFMTRETGAKIVQSSVCPSEGAMYLNEGEVRFSSVPLKGKGLSPLSSGATIEAIVELPEGMKCFYPEVLVRAWGGGETINVQPLTPTNSIYGSFEGVDYALSSTRPFRLISAKRDLFWAYTLKKLDAE